MHTPGPWHVTEDGCDFYVEPTNDFTVAICSVLPIDTEGAMGDYTRGPVTHANARLIAHAPELNASLRKLLTEYEETLNSEFGGTRYCQQALAELQPYRDLLAAVEGGAA